MNNNPINLYKLGTFPKTRKLIKSPYVTDVFEKGVCFKGKETLSNNGFISWADKTGFLNGQLQEVLANKENKIGSGFSHSVYSIPNNEDYVIRTSNYGNLSGLDFSKAEIKDVEDKNLKVNIGQKVAEIDIPSEDAIPYRIEVLQKQSGVSLGIAPYEALAKGESGALRDGELPYEAFARKQHYAKSIDSVAQMDVSSYEKLISDYMSASESGYRFDHLNSNNLLIDNENGTINLIDMEKGRTGANLGNLLYALTNICYLETFASQYGMDPMGEDDVKKAYSDTIQIISKFTQAMKNKNLKFNQNDCSYEFMNLINSAPFTFYCRTFDFGEKWAKLEKMGLAN